MSSERRRHSLGRKNEQKPWMHSMHAFHNCINICELCKEVVKLTSKFTHSVDRICKYQEPYDVFYIQFHPMWQITTKQLHIFIVCSKHTLAKLLCNLLCVRFLKFNNCDLFLMMIQL